MRLRFGRAAAATLIVISGIGLASPSARAANLDEACGGPDKITCNSALWCRKAAGQCSAPDAAGTCEKAPDFCMRVSRPVCGCNGKTYQNECDARHAKVAVDYTGACKKSPSTETAPAAKPVAKKKKKAPKASN
ncbi:Kazal-type serine protease inhibitor family protein [Bradyrhizobium canariense]|uniref:Kazal-type serine protease inhibitor domain-containing protein n=1 Tax=Bradyrhizobium canariense TaxID=255045 RepID=A0A1H1Z0Y5_9BRAD|nr:Kazal-type serine protease inhibitor family protein [Bradyrhizobium canariense]SDT27257.1 Kazal-type serine protease inhibitor domain-containing protein [Bradyrhizobium canariense]